MPSGKSKPEKANNEHKIGDIAKLPAAPKIRKDIILLEKDVEALVKDLKNAKNKKDKGKDDDKGKDHKNKHICDTTTSEVIPQAKNVEVKLQPQILLPQVKDAKLPKRMN